MAGFGDAIMMLLAGGGAASQGWENIEQRRAKERAEAEAKRRQGVSDERQRLSDAVDLDSRGIVPDAQRENVSTLPMPGMPAQQTNRIDSSRYRQLPNVEGYSVDTTRTPEARADRKASADREAALAEIRARAETRAPRALRSVTLADGVWMVDSVTGEKVSRVGNRPPTNSTEPSWQAITTDQGVVQVNPKTGETRNVQAPGGGQQLRGRTPVAVQNAMMQNAKQLGVLDTALAELEKRPQGVGPLRGRSDMLDQQVDPEGTALRAAIADIGSMEIVTRSGAAVSIHEFARLAPFIPSASDKPAVVKIKLQRMRAIIQEEAELNAQRLAGTLGQPTASTRTAADAVGDY